MLDSGERRPFGALLRRHRLLAGLTQAALAEQAFGYALEIVRSAR